MKSNWFFIAGFLLILASCATPVMVPSYREKAESALLAGNYEESTEAWKLFFQQHPGMNDLEGSTYAMAAKTAYQAGETALAVEWFDQARYRNYSDYEMYKTLAAIYKRQDNLSKELSALEYIKENFDSQDTVADSRLFTIYHEIDMVDKALNAWKSMSQEHRDEVDNLEKYFMMNRQLDNESVCDSISRLLLNIDANNQMASEWNAMKYYHRAEARYQKAMTDYENNRTRRQYRVLLNELESATSDYKQALTIFEKLWKLNPGERLHYATFMSNIYVRFRDEKRALYYRNYREP